MMVPTPSLLAPTLDPASLFTPLLSLLPSLLAASRALHSSVGGDQFDLTMWGGIRGVVKPRSMMSDVCPLLYQRRNPSYDRRHAADYLAVLRANSLHGAWLVWKDVPISSETWTLLNDMVVFRDDVAIIHNNALHVIAALAAGHLRLVNLVAASRTATLIPADVGYLGQAASLIYNAYMPKQRRRPLCG